MAIDSSSPAVLPHDHPLAEALAPGWASEWGEDRRFGPFVILELSGQGTADVVRQRWRWIPPGSFQMGSPKSEPGRWSDEGPQHRVTLTRGFWMADTPCTQELWEAVTGKNPSRFVHPQRPVEQVSWNDVAQFVEQLNAKLPGLNAMLPTEAQWEYACRAGSTEALYAIPGSTGEIEIRGERDAPALDPIAWYGGNSGVKFELKNGWDSSDWPQKQYPHERAGTHPVGQKQANDWGLYDMLGNVWEWCADGKRTYSEQSATDAVGPLGRVESRVIRGGSWSNNARNVRCADRNQYPAENQRNNLGFRLVRVQEGS